jgi:hypothetical protein
MHKRLIENWLDNINERSLQAPFCQTLLSKGHTIIHSSRHCAAELGKDIITIDESGAPCAFQLKGHPRGRLTLGEWRKILPQIMDLINLPISDLSLSKIPHKSYLVTNGLVEEEVRIAIKAQNEGFVRDGLPNRILHIVDRGILLKDFIEAGTTLWPNEITRINDLLSILVADGRDWYPVEIAHRIFLETLRLECDTKLGTPEARRRINSASLLTFLTLQPFYREANHLAIITGLTQGIAYIIAAIEKHLDGNDRAGNAAISAMKDEVITSLYSLLSESLENDFLIEGDPQLDFPFHRPRITLLLGLFGALYLTCEADPTFPHPAEFFNKYGDKALLWGEGAIPSLVMYYYYLCHTKSSSKAEALLAKVLTALLLPPDQSKVWKASPYYTISDIIRHQMSFFLGPSEGPLQKESLGHRSFFARSLLFLLMRAGRKQACKSVWGAFTKIESTDFIPRSRADFCLWRTNNGKETHLQPQTRKNWEDLVDEMCQITTDYIPSYFQDDPFLLAVFSNLFPYRMTFDVARLLDAKIGFFHFYRR